MDPAALQTRTETRTKLQFTHSFPNLKLRQTRAIPDGQRRHTHPTVISGSLAVPGSQGSAEIRQFEAEFYRAPGYRAWNLTIDEIRFVAPDAVLVEISSTTTIDGGGLSDRMTLVVVRQGAEWKIAAVRIMNVEEQPP